MYCTCSIHSHYNRSTFFYEHLYSTRNITMKVNAFYNKEERNIKYIKNMKWNMRERGDKKETEN